jgi:peptidoglycan/LPS O-acetylase OafA/YrhL
MNYRKDIQILRGIAVFLVVLYHLGFSGFHSGFFGVDVFFVISGFLMSVLYDENKKLEFYKKRALRLLPAYFVTIIATLIASIFIVTPNEYMQVFNQSLYADLFASNIGYLLQNSYFSKAEFKPLLHLWSLGVEIQFYLLIPIIFYFLKINKYFFGLLFIASVSLCFILVEFHPVVSFFMMPLRLWEFLIGYAVAKYLTSNGSIVKKQYSLLGSFFLLVIILIPILNINGESLGFISGHPGVYALFITLSTGIILSVGISKVIEKSIVGSFLELIGKYSYSIYLVHFPVIVLFLYQPFSGTQLQASGLHDLLLLLIIIVSLSYGMYHLIESNLRKISSVHDKKYKKLP